MGRSRLLVSASIVTLLAFSFFSEMESATFKIVNKCRHTIWPGVLSGANTEPLSPTGFALKSGKSRTLSVPKSWSGRMWARTLCSGTFPGNFSCLTADCGSGKIECAGSGAKPPATLAEFTLNGTDGLDFYDVSLVDGYNLPVLVVPRGGKRGGCSPTGCLVDLNSACPKALRVARVGKGGGVVAWWRVEARVRRLGNRSYVVVRRTRRPRSVRPRCFRSTLNMFAHARIATRMMTRRVRILVRRLTTLSFSALYPIPGDVLRNWKQTVAPHFKKFGHTFIIDETNRLLVLYLHKPVNSRLFDRAMNVMILVASGLSSVWVEPVLTSKLVFAVLSFVPDGMSQDLCRQWKCGVFLLEDRVMVMATTYSVILLMKTLVDLTITQDTPFKEVLQLLEESTEGDDDDISQEVFQMYEESMEGDDNDISQNAELLITCIQEEQAKIFNSSGCLIDLRGSKTIVEKATVGSNSGRHLDTESSSIKVAGEIISDR